MHIIWGSHRNKVSSYTDMGLHDTTECFSLAAYIKLLQRKEFSGDDVLVLCENRSQVTLNILRSVPAKHLPKGIVVLTKEPFDFWLAFRIPRHVRKILSFTTKPAEVRKLY